MVDEDSNHEISSLVWIAGIIISVIISLVLLTALVNVAPSKRADVWWFYVTIIVAFLVGEVMSITYDKIASRNSSEILVPIKFVFYWLAVIIAATGGMELLQNVANIFNNLTPYADIAFVILSFLPTFGLFFAFAHHEKLRMRHRNSKPS